ncbi:hypothetical protein NC653_010622 [Populus alba x Populus x berolinensis]|uniref:Uncharacterized protein n=1 Tax=Populus alba x Populus x berolinensis TaxID=444605 RepID=A0AAD6R057_9ROSI|nr:hypothetical protein NC653_010622 [Populus alba x Populus x berolinensis]
MEVLTANSFETVNLNYIKLGTFTSDTLNHELDLSKGVLAPSEVLFLLSFVLC